MIRKYKVIYQHGESITNPDVSVDFMQVIFHDEDGNWRQLYAERELTEDFPLNEGNEFRIYKELKKEIIEQAEEYEFLNKDMFIFPYDQDLTWRQLIDKYGTHGRELEMDESDFKECVDDLTGKKTKDLDLHR